MAVVFNDSSASYQTLVGSVIPAITTVILNPDIDISDNANPTRIGGYDTTGDARGVQVVENYAYVADYDGGLQIIDISDNANPTRIGGYDTTG
ncbi:hypothetical protein, partial [Umezakia ovalisporum]